MTDFLIPFWITPLAVRDFIDQCVGTETSARVMAFYRSWRACGLLRGDIDSFLAGIKATRASLRTTGTPAAKRSDNFLEELLEGVDSGMLPSLKGPPGPHVPRPWNDIEKHLDPTIGACVVLHPPNTRAQAFEHLKLAANSMSAVKVIDKFALSNASHVGFNELTRFLVSQGVRTIELTAACRGAAKRRDIPPCDVARAGVAALGSSLGVTVSLRPVDFDSMSKTAHDRFIAFTTTTSKTGVAAQLGPGVGCLGEAAVAYPVSISRIPFQDFEKIYKLY